MTAGVRLPDGFDCTTPALEALGLATIPRGAYWKDPEGTWAILTPNGRLGSIAKHTVVEHDDGTITVSPSILVYAFKPIRYTPDERVEMVKIAGEDDVTIWEGGRPEYHGWLERGVWRDA